MKSRKISQRRKLSLQAIEQMQQLTALFTRRRAQLAQLVGLTDAQWRVLEEISSEHFMPSLFAREQEHTRGAVSKILRQLVEKQLIEVSISAEDGRQRNYELTEGGQRALGQLREAREAAIEQTWEQLSVKDLQALTRIHEDLFNRLREYALEQEKQG